MDKFGINLNNIKYNVHGSNVTIKETIKKGEVGIVNNKIYCKDVVGSSVFCLVSVKGEGLWTTEKRNQCSTTR